MSTPTQKCTYFLTNLETFTRTEHVKQIIVPRLQFEQLTILTVFLPSTVRLWNNFLLIINIVFLLPPLKIFLSQHYYYTGSRIGQIHHTRICSLKDHLFKKNLEQDP